MQKRENLIALLKNMKNIREKEIPKMKHERFIRLKNFLYPLIIFPPRFESESSF
jgi:hypothetical protein